MTGSAPASGKANIMVYSINSDGPDFRALVTGAIGDYGPAVTVRPDGTVDPSHTSDMELRLSRGSFRLSIAELDRKFVQAASHEPIYPRTCSDFMDVTAKAPIRAGMVAARLSAVIPGLARLPGRLLLPGAGPAPPAPWVTLIMGGAGFSRIWCTFTGCIARFGAPDT